MSDQDRQPAARPSRAGHGRTAGHVRAGHRSAGPEPASAPPGWYDPRAPRPRNALGTVALVLAVIALVAGPLVYLILDPMMSPGWGFISLLLALVALGLAFAGLRRLRRLVATNRAQTVTAVCLAGSTLVLVVVQGTASGIAFNSDAATLCSGLSGQYTMDGYTSAIDEATTFGTFQTRIDRSRLMVSTQCPDEIRGVVRVERFLTRGVY